VNNSQEVVDSIFTPALESILRFQSRENVSLVRVNPSYTSQRCPICGFTEKENRKAEVFKCLRCGYVGDADHVGALNILSQFYEESEVPHVGGIRNG